ncbi:M48 family metallopeptidase [Sinomonas atrocyanea]|uniref:M48 metallopeptidase family protein n=1 Tax=Sinomonas atrocyanea TaxID=37927 RepID=UPI002780AD07|nr:M48 family metallopeptidase [Sinomonas atrocyanea]MDQ0258435.1 putative metal-dependent hydrolase [Sinomonas atrocyanea]MDR6620704.1 putative metal-dependent hydrolase [Sinomonas atrocyanea]
MAREARRAPGQGALPLTEDGPPVEVRRSGRRRKTVSAFWEGSTAVVAIPASFTRAQEAHWVERMVERLQQDTARRRGAHSDEALMERAAALSQQYFGGRTEPASIRWVTNQRRRWGSCTPSQRTIRLSHELQGMPEWVVDYVIVHELAHLLVSGHGPQFWELVGAYPRLAEAKAFLAGVAFAGSGRGDAGDGGAGDGGGWDLIDDDEDA